MKIKKSHVSIGLLILILSLSVAGAMNQSFKPKFNLDSPKSSAGELTIVTPENITYIGPDSGYYPGIWGFEDGNIGFEDLSSETVDLQESAGDHKGVLRLYDTSTSFSCVLQFDFENQVQGTVEIWFMKTIGQSGLYLDFRDSSIDEKKIQTLVDYNNNGQFNIAGVGATADYSDNTWFHLKFDFDCTTDKVDLYINGNLEFDDIDFNIPTDHLNRFILATNSFYSGTFFVDALGNSWDPNYSIGDNVNEGLLLSYENSTNLDWQGYSLDDQANITILGNKTIKIPSDGQHRIQVYGNDTMGAMYESNPRFFTVNTAPPDITINSPTDSQIISSAAPSYDISIAGPYDSIWYALEGGTNYTASGLSGKIDQTAWSALSDGIITIDFYANNTAGMEGTAQVMVFKDRSEEPPPTPPEIPGYDLSLLIGALSVISAILIRKRMKS